MTAGVESFETPCGIPVTVITWPSPEPPPVGLRSITDHAAQAGVPVSGPEASAVYWRTALQCTV